MGHDSCCKRKTYADHRFQRTITKEHGKPNTLASGGRQRCARVADTYKSIQIMCRFQSSNFFMFRQNDMLVTRTL